LITHFPLANILMHFRDVRDQSLKLSKIAPNFGKFLSSQNLGGGVCWLRQNFCPSCHACLAAHHMEKFRELTPTGPKVNTLNSKPIFKCSFLKIVRGDPVPSGVCASKPWSFSSASEIWSSKKVDLGGSKCTFRTLLLVDQSSSVFFAERRRNCSRHSSFPFLAIF